MAFSTLCAANISAQDDLVVADFEGKSYEPWIAEGEAFGSSPAQGTLPGQMAVEGFEGHGLVNSFRGGDDSTGTLTSLPFRVERRYLNFLIGGGKFPEETCLDLLLDGVVVRTATGPNDKPGGSERLEWASWDIAELAGKTVVVRVVDHRKGGWGHINVDQIVQSDRARGVKDTAREITAEAKYLYLPVDEKAPMRRVKVSDGGRWTREFDIKLAEEKPSFRTFLDLASVSDRRLKIETRLPNDSKALEGITQEDSIPSASSLYQEKGRPQFHFTSRRGWLNDPNGLVSFEGEYHLFYQHNPYGWDWGNMHWGHAVSPDLVQWKELPIALYPHRYGDMAFSGSAVVDTANTSGFGVGRNPALVAAFTSTGRGECIVFSNDRGRTWTEFSGNPVVKHPGRDPRLLWHEPSKRWVMAVYDEEGGKRDVVFHSSPDLKNWKSESRIGGFFECPDLFELPIEGTPGKTLWVLSAADGAYLLGQFDGKTFIPDSPEKHQVWHGDFYAAQTFSNEPKGRRVQIGWARGIAFPGEPFNQQMGIPCELTLRTTEQGIRLFANPVEEVASLRKGSEVRSIETASPGAGLSTNIPVGELFDLRLAATVGRSGELKIEMPGATLAYDIAGKLLTCNGVSAPMNPMGDRIKLRVLVDRGSIEVIGNDGIVAISRGLTDRKGSDGSITVVYKGEGKASVMVEANELKSSWR
jgi:fructan beta-fructosidase